MSVRRLAVAVQAGALAMLVATTGAGSANDVAGAEQDYALTCAGCHGFDGAGSERVPSLRTIARYLGSDDGRSYLVRVPGVAQAPLDDERLARLLNWVLARDASVTLVPYSAAEVGALRARPLVDPLAARRELEAALASAISPTQP